MHVRLLNDSGMTYGDLKAQAAPQPSVFATVQEAVAIPRQPGAFAFNSAGIWNFFGSTSGEQLLGALCSPFTLHLLFQVLSCLMGSHLLFQVLCSVLDLYLLCQVFCNALDVY